MTVAIGVDVGNALVKVVGPDADLSVLIPHVLAPATTTRNVSLVKDDANPLEYLHAELESPPLPPLKVYLGDLALNEYPTQSEEANGEQKSTSNRHLILALLAAAAAVQQRSVFPDAVRVPVGICLPVTEYLVSGSEERLADRLAGEHRVRWLSTPRWRGLERTLVVDRVTVVPEAAAAYFAVVTRDPRPRAMP